MKSALMLGVNPNAMREENDYYATHPHAIEIMLDKFKDIGLSDSEEIKYVYCWWYNPKNELSDEEIYLNWYKYYKMK